MKNWYQTLPNLSKRTKIHKESQYENASAKIGEHSNRTSTVSRSVSFSEWQQGHQKKHHHGCHHGCLPLLHWHGGSAERHEGSTNPMPTLSLTKVRTMTHRSLSEDSTGLARSFSLASLQPLQSNGKQKVVKRWQHSKDPLQATENGLAGISRRPWKSESCSNLRVLSPQPGVGKLT